MDRLFDVTQLWVIDAPVDPVIAVLADPLGYPRWWPQVRSADRVEPAGQATDIGEPEAVRMRVRSILPYSLHLVLTRRREDRAAGVLEAGLGGDLRGWSRMVIFAGVDARTRVSYRQRVVVTASWLAPWAGALAPALVANHAWMMRGGERGLRREVRRG